MSYISNRSILHCKREKKYEVFIELLETKIILYACPECFLGGQKNHYGSIRISHKIIYNMILVDFHVFFKLLIKFPKFGKSHYLSAQFFTQSKILVNARMLKLLFSP